MINDQQQMLAMELQLQGEDVSDEDFISLETYIRDEYIRDLSVSAKRSPPKTGELGLDLVALSVILAAPAVVKLVECLNTWILGHHQTQRIKLVFNVDGRTLEMESEGFSEAQIEAFCEQLLAILRQ